MYTVSKPNKCQTQTVRKFEIMYLHLTKALSLCMMEGAGWRERAPVFPFRDKTAKNDGAKWQKNTKGQII